MADWGAVAVSLLEGSSDPMFVLDKSGVIVATNIACERLLGRTRDGLVGHSWLGTCCPSDQQRATRALIDDALRGSLVQAELVAETKTGSKLALFGRLSAVGDGDYKALLVRIDRAVTLWPREFPLSAVDRYYELDLAHRAPGRVRFLMTTESSTRPLPETPCYVAFAGRDRPCAGCPAFSPAQRGDTKTGVVHLTQHGDLAIVTVHFAERAEVTYRPVSRSMLKSLVRAQIEQVAEQGGLSDRERSVLGLLVQGCSTDTMAAILEIAPRTVKFHQANVLDKLRVESRLDLLRLVFDLG